MSDIKLRSVLQFLLAGVFFVLAAMLPVSGAGPSKLPAPMPPGMPGMPEMFPGGMPNLPPPEPREPSEIELLAAKSYRPKWAPLGVFRGDARAVSVLLSICNSPDADNRAKAAFILGQTRDTAAAPKLTKMLEDKDPNVRIHAAIALSEMGNGAGISQLAKGFDTAQPWVKCYAVHALWNINTRFARSILQERQKNQPQMVSDIISQALKTEHTIYPKVKSDAVEGKAQPFSSVTIWMEANGLLLEESDFWWHAGDYDQAIRCLEAAVFFDPTDVESYSVIAWLQWSMDRDALGIDAMDRCIAKNPNNWEAHGELGLYFTRARRWEEAEKPLEKAVQLGADVLIHKSYAHCLEKMGKIGDSLKEWEKLHLKHPQDDVIKNNLNRVKRLSEGQQ